MHNIQTIFINPPKYTKHDKHLNTHNTTTVVPRDNAISQYQLCLHNITGEERDRRNVGEVTPNSRDPEKNS